MLGKRRVDENKMRGTHSHPWGSIVAVGSIASVMNLQLSIAWINTVVGVPSSNSCSRLTELGDPQKMDCLDSLAPKTLVKWGDPQEGVP
jgi:hypothetical protein